MPLSHEAKQALSHAADEAEELKHSSIDSGHLVLGVFAMKGKAAEALDHQGVSHAAYREALAGSADPVKPVPPVTGPVSSSQTHPDEAPGRETAAPSLREPVSKLSRIVEQTFVLVAVSTENFGYQRLKRKPWTRKEALGHLIDCAAIHHGWFVRASTEPNVSASGYPEDSWVAAQRYTEISWRNLLELWASLNRLLVHVLANVPEEKLGMSYRIGVEEPKTLGELITGYVEHVENVVGQMLAHG